MPSPSIQIAQSTTHVTAGLWPQEDPQVLLGPADCGHDGVQVARWQVAGAESSARSAR